MFDTLTRMGASASGDYEIERSLRFNSADDTYLARTPSSAGNRKTWTLSYWIKLTGNLDQVRQIFSRGNTSGGDWFFIYQSTDGFIQPYIYEGGGSNWPSETSGKMRDPAAWYHVVVRMDTTQATASNRMRIYINGVLDTWNNINQPTQNTDLEVNTTSVHYFGRAGQAGQRGDFYLAEVHFLDGQSLDASNFGKTNAITKQWIPKKYGGGNYGTNGFYLDFSDNSGTTATTLGKDSSGQGNNWTPSNFSVTAGDATDSKTDTPTRNKAVINPLTAFTDSATGTNLTDGNLKLTGSSGFKNISTIGFPGTGKFYYESVRTSAGGWQLLGVFRGVTNNPSNAVLHSQIYGFASTAAIYDGGNYSASGAPSWGNGDVMGVKYNNGTLQIYKNGTLNGTSITGIPTNETIFAYISNDNTSSTSYMRFSSDDWTQDTAASVDEEWEMSTANLPEPTIKDPSKFFNTGTYTGTGSSNAITGLGFQPDHVVIKMRSTANQDFCVFDSVRGATRVLRWNTQETSDPQTTRFTSFDSDGFTVGTENITNQSSKNFVYWAWKESASAGFDMVKYTGNGSSPRTVSHSLGVVPEMYWIKNMESNGTIWVVGNKTIDADENVFLSSSDDDENAINYWASTRPTSSVFTVNNNDAVNKNGEEHIAYLFASVEGMCKVGTYTGNGNNDGAFLHLGFRPSFFLVKNTNDNEHWALYDDARGFNDNNPYAVPSGYNNMVELTDVDLDINSNGIKFRAGHNRTNHAENTSAYIYLAMARSPFKYANAR